MIHLLAGYGFRSNVRRRLADVHASLSEVSPTALPASVIDSFRYHRLNDDYELLHHFCRLFLGGASVREDIGPVDFRAFLIDMNSLFETFVTRMLQERAREDFAVGGQAGLYLDTNRNVWMIPDIVVRHRGRAVVVADCKYKRLEPGGFKHHDLYQVLAYCTAARVSTGVLIYPKHTVSITEEVRVRGTEITIHQLTIDLGRERDALEHECDDLARHLFRWCRSEAS